MEQRLDFKATVETLTSLSTKAQCTFLYLLISVLSPMVLRTIMRYCCRRLDQINKELPDTHPYKSQYLNRGKRRLVQVDWGNWRSGSDYSRFLNVGVHVHQPANGKVNIPPFNPDLQPYKDEEVDRW